LVCVINNGGAKPPNGYAVAGGMALTCGKCYIAIFVFLAQTETNIKFRSMRLI